VRIVHGGALLRGLQDEVIQRCERVTAARRAFGETIAFE
jgi:hypothetical protein